MKNYRYFEIDLLIFFTFANNKVILYLHWWIILYYYKTVFIFLVRKWISIQRESSKSWHSFDMLSDHIVFLGKRCKTTFKCYAFVWTSKWRIYEQTRMFHIGDFRKYRREDTHNNNCKSLSFRIDFNTETPCFNIEKRTRSSAEAFDSRLVPFYFRRLITWTVEFTARDDTDTGAGTRRERTTPTERKITYENR